MTGRFRLLKITGLIVIGLFLLIGLIYVFLSTEQVNSLINRQLESQDLSLTPAAHKTLLPGLAWDSPVLSSPQGALVSCDKLFLRLRLLPLLAGRVKLGASAVVRGGQLDLEYGLNGREALVVDSSGINLADIPFFKSVLSARVAGEVWVKGSASRGSKGLNGELRFEVKKLEFSGVRLGAFPLPDAANLRSQGMIRITEDRLRLESFTLQGEGVYMRLSGDIPNGDSVTAPLNLILEIMPKPDFLERQKLVFLLLSKFMVSPGNFRIPVRGTLLKPVVL
ncbi:MAG: type II secretion system protein GspN [Desulfuromonadales bacterium]|nr:type II secretion system protein GspN [Desulfuromonadales bacterium]